MTRSDGGSARPYAVLAVALVLCACKPAPNETSKGVTVDLPPALPADVGNGSEPVRNAVVPVPPPAVPEPEAVKPPSEVKPKKEASAPAAATAAAAAAATAKPDEPADDAKQTVPPPVTEAKPTTPVAEPKPGAARPPLSNERIAGTIERIGYPCGSVVSADRVESSGSEQRYKIVCSSGDAYRGTNRNGHMRFRKWGGN